MRLRYLKQKQKMEADVKMEDILKKLNLSIYNSRFCE